MEGHPVSGTRRWAVSDEPGARAERLAEIRRTTASEPSWNYDGPRVFAHRKFLLAELDRLTAERDRHHRESVEWTLACQKACDERDEFNKLSFELNSKIGKLENSLMTRAVLQRLCDEKEEHLKRVESDRDTWKARAERRKAHIELLLTKLRNTAGRARRAEAAQPHWANVPTMTTLMRERDEWRARAEAAEAQQRHGWDRHAEKDRAYQAALDERDAAIARAEHWERIAKERDESECRRAEREAQEDRDAAQERVMSVGRERDAAQAHVKRLRNRLSERKAGCLCQFASSTPRQCGSCDDDDEALASSEPGVKPT